MNDSVIHAAIARPKMYLAYHEDCDLHAVCAVLIDSLARNHAFVEGNKHTGLMSAILTYELNGVLFQKYAGSSKDFENLVLWVVLEKPEIPEIAEKLKMVVDKYKIAKTLRSTLKGLKAALKPFGED